MAYSMQEREPLDLRHEQTARLSVWARSALRPRTRGAPALSAGSVTALSATVSEVSQEGRSTIGWEAFRESDRGIAEAIAGRGEEWPGQPTN